MNKNSPRQPVPKLSVVAPCHNEEGNIDELCRRVADVCRQAVDENFEIVLVNDGSNDDTWETIKRNVENGNHVVGVNLSRNHGHQLALSAGLSICRGERILVIDADLQDPPELLPKMMGLMDQGADVVYGQRSERKGDSRLRKAASNIFYRLLQKLSDVDIPLDTGDFRLMSRRVLDVLLAMPEQHRFIRGMISWIGYRQVPINYQRLPRERGETSYTMRRLFSFAIDAFTGFSTKPLRLAMFLGFITTILSIVYVVRIFISTVFFGVDVEGWASLMAVILLFSGIQMMILGLVGEYLGRVFQEVKKRPLFVIKEIVAPHDDIKNLS